MKVGSWVSLSTAWWVCAFTFLVGLAMGFFLGYLWDVL